MTRRGVWLYAAGMAAAIALPVVAARLHPLPPGRCERDGVQVGGEPAARVLEDDGTTHAFCSIRCAEAWISRRGGDGTRVLVRDEISGKPLPSGDAWFVENRTAGASGLRLRAFARREDAAAYVAAFGGTLVPRRERPFQDPGPP